MEEEKVMSSPPGVKTFGGERYTIVDIQNTKGFAKIKAKSARDRGFKIRVVPFRAKSRKTPGSFRPTKYVLYGRKG